MTCPHCQNAITEAVEFCPSCLGQLGPAATSGVSPLIAQALQAEAAALPDHELGPGGSGFSEARAEAASDQPASSPELLGASAAATEADPGPTGIGGWLILPAIGLVVSPLLMLFLIFSELLPIFAGDTLAVLTNPASEAYHPLWQPLLVFELVANTLGVVAFVIAAVLFFTRRAAAPRWMIGLYLARVLMQFVDEALGSEIPAVAQAEEGASELVRAAIQAMIWIPYFLVSKRVKNTFTR